jgi:8-oxo-dGTP pyrophosphatase MutT (NUDIX family)
MDIERAIALYTPFNEQETQDKDLILHCLATEKDVFSRDNALAHMTASAWVVNSKHDKVLMVYHNIYQSWSWLGGHADGDRDLLAVALREVQEESGLRQLNPVMTDIFSLESLTVDGHEKHGHYVSSHLHLNVTYLIEADETEPLKIKKDENSGVRWFSLEDAIASSTERWFQKRIYRKLNDKLALLANK